MVDLNPGRAVRQGHLATDVSNALNCQNLILPGGTAKIGAPEYQIKLNSSPSVLDELNDLPMQGGERGHGLHAGCGAGARRLRGADTTSCAPTARAAH